MTENEVLHALHEHCEISEPLNPWYFLDFQIASVFFEKTLSFDFHDVFEKGHFPGIGS